MECPPTLPVWTQDPNICRCCLAISSNKYLAAEYSYCGQKEVYQDMLMETFNINILDNMFQGSNGRICDLCIQMLRDAYSFKKMVWNSVKTVNEFISNISNVIEVGISQHQGQTTEGGIVKAEPPDPEDTNATDNTIVPDVANEGVEVKVEPDIIPDTEDPLNHEALIEPPADPITVCEPIVKEEDSPMAESEAKPSVAGDEEEEIIVPDKLNGDDDDDDDSDDDVSDASDTTDSDNAHDEWKNPKQHVPLKTWDLIQKFDSEEDAFEFLKVEDTWSSTLHRRTDEGLRKYYRCNKVKRSGPQCSAALCLLFADDGTVTAYKTANKHDHDRIGIYNAGIKSERTKEEIKKLFKLRMTPKLILAKLSKIKGIDVPTQEELEAYLQKERSKGQRDTIDYKELQRWIDKHSDTPRSFKKPFVLSNDVNDGRIPSFRFAISTKGLLKLLCSTDILHADTTATLTWRGWPVYVIGATDKLHKFHPVCLAVASGERKEDFQVTFQGLKDKVEEIYNHTFKPRVLVCNASQTIKSAFVRVFGSEPVIRTCWSQVRTSVCNEISNLLKKEDEIELLSDLEYLHYASNLKMFNMAAKAFLDKWKKEKKIMKFIKDQWFSKYRNWYVGAAPLSPLTNGDLALFIKKIQDRSYIRDMLKFRKFLVLACGLVKSWSTEYFLSPVERMVELEHWREGYILSDRDLKIEVTETDSTKTVYQISDKNSGLKYTENWCSFNEYREQIATFRRIILPNDDWKNGVCDCQEYFQLFMCRHILALVIRLKPTEPPLEAKDVLKYRRKRRKSSSS